MLFRSNQVVELHLDQQEELDITGQLIQLDTVVVAVAVEMEPPMVELMEQLVAQRVQAAEALAVAQEMAYYTTITTIIQATELIILLGTQIPLILLM